MQAGPLTRMCSLNDISLICGNDDCGKNTKAYNAKNQDDTPDRPLSLHPIEVFDTIPALVSPRQFAALEAEIKRKEETNVGEETE
jgi:hypothetical protein